ncbi:hypothetical protein CROQUDRAFT_674359 [Cronartium quercuum f. sp. fusiforme G11]|uniref:Core domain-containing protein n=1 Tax=Cronartium quercuum f. sp. fusiforme G11 TaxID=708437 RepID=A0A9P6NAY3_9BASI|nr:hypothetical protein CROQUDRAFT_674359 [Cronartium quercuum f. sp. fusiforme G11]
MYPNQLQYRPQRTSITNINSSSFSSKSLATSSSQLASPGPLDQERTSGLATLLSGPSLADAPQHDLPPELRSMDSTNHKPSLEPRIRITEAAARRIRHVQLTDKKSTLVLRLAVESGGCHGFQYKMSFTDDLEPEDYLFTIGKEGQGLVAIDRSSLDLMNGSTIDFATELIGSSFRVLDNPNAAGPGCGCGVSWELK